MAGPRHTLCRLPTEHRFQPFVGGAADAASRGHAHHLPRLRPASGQSRCAEPEAAVETSMGRLRVGLARRDTCGRRPAPSAPAPASSLAPAPAPVVPSPLTLNTHTAATPPKRPLSPEAPQDEKKAKRDKKPKKKRGHSRAGSGTETPPGATPAPPPVPVPAGAAWAGRNGTHSDRKKNGVRSALDPYAALVNRMPPAGAKKVKTTKELLAQIQSRGSRRALTPRAAASPASPASPADPDSPDVMFIEPDEPSPVKVESPLRNGGSPAPASPAPARAPSPPPLAPLEDERE
ncbi:uncharacterized protein, partial [Choristoneura fumiferana]|uniref:uncharacterized protein n=1 Tax=Choristoneura fumiferana TaxID=7141 RepID=UPI003D156E41